MSTVNKAIIIGHLGADPEIRRTQDGREIATFSLATGERWKEKTTGEQKEITDWHRVVVFNEGLAKIAGQYLKKGSKAYVEGTIRTRKWQDQAGVDRYTTEIILSAYNGKLTLLDRSERAPPPDETSYGGSQAPAPATQRGPRGDMDDEIPF